MVFTLHTIQSRYDKKHATTLQDALNFNTYIIKHIAKERKRKAKANQKHIDLLTRMLHLNLHKLSKFADLAWQRRDIQPFDQAAQKYFAAKGTQSIHNIFDAALAN